MHERGDSNPQIKASSDIKAARAGHGGPLVTLQHVAVKSPGHPISTSLYANACEIARACEEAGVLSIGGHDHRSAGVEREGKSAYLAVKALKDAPRGPWT